MQEKQITLNDVVGVWWYTFWRTFVVTIFFVFITNFLLAAILLGVIDSGFIEILSTPLTLVVSVFCQIYFLKEAINRDYKGFRLSAVSK